MFFWNSLAFSMTQQMLAIWSLVPLPFLQPAWTSDHLPPNFKQEAAWLTLPSSLIPNLCRAFHYKTKHFFMFIGQSRFLMKCFFLLPPLFFKSGCSFSFDRSTLYILDTCALKGIWITIYFPTLAFCSFKWLFFDEHVFKTVKYTISFIVSTFLWESCLRNPYYCWDFVSSTSVTSFLSVGFKL